MTIHVNRRRFLTLSASAAALPMLGAAQTPPKPASGLPAPLASLKDRRSEAQPISLAEREERFTRAQRKMQENGIDAIALIGGTSLVYFTGIRWWNSERLFVAVLPQKGAPFYVCPAFEEERAREQMRQAPAGKDSQVYTWQEDEDPYALVAKGLKDLGLSGGKLGGKLGIEERVTFVFSDGIRKAIPGFETVSATPVTAGCRAVKSAAELKLMQLANDVTLSVYEAAWKSILAAGPGTVEGYQSDISRSFTLGKPTERMKHVFDVVHQAQAAALAAAKPGVPCGAIDAAARKVVDDAGFGPAYAHFTHRVGHGIGMDGHEWPYLVKGNPTPLEVGNCFSDEPGIYLRGEFGIRLEDDWHLTEDGGKLFTPQSPSLEEPFARA
jgi:Xaa-Pro dipeptidase